MSESTGLNYASPGFGQDRSLLRVGGSLGISSVVICLIIFTVGCFGFRAVFNWLPLIPLLMSLGGTVLSIAGATIFKSRVDEDTHVLAALFVNVLAIAGSLLELSIWLNWGLFYQGAQTG
jgi:hypothetical protein